MSKSEVAVPEWKPEISSECEPSMKIELAVYQAIGAGSSCWGNIDGAGMFQSDEAVAIGEGLIAFIDDQIKKDWDVFEERIRERRDFWQSYLDSGVSSSERPLAWTRVDTLNGVLKTIEELRPKDSE